MPSVAKSTLKASLQGRECCRAGDRVDSLRSQPFRALPPRRMPRNIPARTSPTRPCRRKNRKVRAIGSPRARAASTIWRRLRSTQGATCAVRENDDRPYVSGVCAKTSPSMLLQGRRSSNISGRKRARPQSRKPTPTATAPPPPARTAAGQTNALCVSTECHS